MNRINTHDCRHCAVKHLASAAVIAREILTGYDTPEYRLYLIGNLNEAQEQLAGIAPGTAGLVRNLRRWIAPGGLEFTLEKEQIRAIEALTRAASGEEAPPEQRPVCTPCGRRKETAPSRHYPLPSPLPGRVDVLLVLRADGSRHGNEELHLALRSIEKHLKGYRDIYLVSSRMPEGFQNLKFIRCDDPYPRKQMNIHHAIRTALTTPGISSEVIFWADDNLLLRDLSVTELPVAARRDDLLGFSGEEGTRVWHRSLRQTGEALKAAGLPTVNYEAHTPVRFQRDKYLALESRFDFSAGVGLCYISLYLNTIGVLGSTPASEIKATFESEHVKPKALEGKLFAGYNDTGLAAGAMRLFRERFPSPSKYERHSVTRPLYPALPKIGAVLGTAGSAPHVDLGLHSLVNLHQLPVLVVNDGGPDPALDAVCAKYGIQPLNLGQRYGHFAGDLRIFAAGLEWARRHGFDLLVKFSRRFIALEPWVDGLIRLARDSNAVTFSSYTTSYHYGFRSECLGLYVPAWSSMLSEIIDAAQPGARVFVERFLHERAIRLAHEWSSPEFEAYSKLHYHGPDKRGYAFWFDMLGNDRRQHRDGFLWHNADAPAVYAAAAAAAGLPYTEEDFGTVRKGKRA